jgi:hypothetical protein
MADIRAIPVGDRLFAIQVPTEVRAFLANMIKKILK